MADVNVNVTVTPATRIGSGRNRKRRYTVTWEVDGEKLPPRTVTMPDDIPDIITDEDELDELYQEIALRATRKADAVDARPPKGQSRGER